LNSFLRTIYFGHYLLIIKYIIELAVLSSAKTSSSDQQGVIVSNNYVLGVCTAILGGIAFYLGLVFQKSAVRKLQDHSKLMVRLLHTPLWLEGFAIQFIIGVPLNLIAAALIGPAIIPGLMATGLIVLVVGSIWLGHEAFDRMDAVGILFVMSAATLFGLSGLGIDMKSINLHDRLFLSRLLGFTIFVAGLSLACIFMQRKNYRLRGIFRTLDAGFLFVQSNLWLSIMMGFLYRWQGGLFSIEDLIPLTGATLIAATGSILGVIETQRAFQVGDATRLVPIQALPQQILPLITYLAVFQLTPPTNEAFILAGAGAALVLLGSTLLARRQVALQ
jgi:hypothetical protein